MIQQRATGKVLVTGGLGFLGRHLVSRLQSGGATVRVFARRRGGAPEAGDLGCEIVWGDVRDSKSVDRAVTGTDTVIHLVSNFRKGGSDRKQAHAVNVEGTKNVLESALKHGVTRFVHCSTIGVHGSVKEVPADEDTPFNPGDLYQETKLLAERQVWDCHRRTGLPVTVVRPISMYGPGDLRMLKLFRGIRGGWFVMVGGGQVLFHPAYIDDVVNGFLLCMTQESAVGEVFIIGGDQYLPLCELVNMVAQKLDVRAPILRLPLRPVEIAAAVCEDLCAPLGIDPPLHRRRVSFFKNNRAFSINKARRLLGFEPTVSLDEGLDHTIHWYRTNGYL